MKSIKELMNLKGRAALVTGGGGYIGGAICDTLAELGADVAVVDKLDEPCRATAERLTADYGVEALALVVDLTNESETRSVCDRVVAGLGRLDILVNCAAFTGDADLEGWVGPFETQSPDTWRKALEINLTVPFVLTQSCSEALSRSGNGAVINISSIYGMAGPDLSLYEGTGRGNPAAYGASKGGLLQLTRWLATVMAPAARVNAITPGGIERGQGEPFRSRYEARTPLGRLGTEEEIKGAAAYLASDLSAYVTGHNLIVDGGWTVW